MVIKNTFWLAFSTITSRFARGALIIYAARILGTEGYGVFSYVISLVALFAIFSDVGLSGILTREASKHPDNIPEYLSTSGVIKIILIVCTIGVVLALGPVVTKIPEAINLLPIVAVLVAFDSLRGFSFSVIRSQNRMELESALDLTTELFITLLGFLALAYHPTTQALAYAYTVGSGIGFVCIFCTLQKYFPFSLAHFNSKLVMPLLRASWPFALIGTLGGLMTNIDSVIIGWLRTPHELGLYAAAQRPISMLYLIPGFLNTSIFPIINILIRDDNRERLKGLLEKSLRTTLAVSLPLAIGGCIVATPLISLLLGAEYMDSANTFRILLLTVVVVSPGMIIASMLFGFDKQKIFIKTSIFGALVNVMLDILLIPRFGIAGSAIATLTALCVLHGWNWYELKRIVPFNGFSKVHSIIYATALMSIATYIGIYLSIPVLITISISGIVYVSALIVFKDQIIRDTVGVLMRR